MITGTIKDATAHYDRDPFHSYMPFPSTRVTLESSVIVDEFSGQIGAGDYVYITKLKPLSVQDLFSEACDNAKSGDTNALAALPYLAELMIKEAHK